MNTRINRNLGAAVLALAALVPLTGSAEAILHGRVSFDAGGTLIKGLEESDWSSASINTLVLPSDTLWVDNGGTTEVEFSGGSFLRMADGSKAEVAALPPNATIRGWTGSFYVQRLTRSQGDFVFETPAGSIVVEPDSMVRIDITGERLTTVSTRWGRATVRTDAGGTVQAYAGKRVFIETGLLPSEPASYDRSAEDAFDRWNRERAEYLATGSTSTPVDVSYETLGVSDLDRYGEWVYVDNRPFWRPTVVVDYTPYRYGYWNYCRPVGNVWVGNYPFCYVTSHYGYWDYTPSYGWVWSYDRVWSPAWCATVQYGDYFVWAPVNRYYRPVYPTTSAYFSIGGVSFGYFGTSCVRASDLYLGPSYVHFANYDPFRRYYGTGNVTVNIWNINTSNRRPHVAVPYSDSTLTVRDYTPRRSIRGAETLFASNRSASERVQRLETVSGRSSFGRADRAGTTFTRTDSARIDVSSRTRNVRLDQAAPEYTRASRSNPVVASNPRTRPDSDGATLTRSRDRQDSTRSRDSVSTSGTESRGTAAREGRSTPRQTTIPGTGEASTRTRSTDPVATRSDTPRRTDSVATRGDTPRRTDIDPGFDSDPLRMHTRPAPRSRSTRNTEIAAPSDSTPARTVAPAETGRTVTRSTATSTRTPARTSDPSASTAPATVAERSGDRGARTTTTRPSSPVEVTRTPVDRSRNVERLQTPAPTSRSTTLNPGAPVRTRGGDVVRPTITPQTSAPAETERRSYTAPSRDNGRSSYTAPGRDNSRSSYTAPSAPASRPSYTPPSRNTSSSAPSTRSFSAPSSSSGSRASSTPAPSRSFSSSNNNASRSSGGRGR
jgi:hypothetical protein